MSKIDSHIEGVLAWHQKRHQRARPLPKGKRKPVTLSAMPTQWDRGADGPANQERLRTEPAVDIDPETGKETPNPNGVKRRRRAPWLYVYGKHFGDAATARIAAGDALRMAAEGMREKDPLAAIIGVRSQGGADPVVARLDARAYFRQIWERIPPASRPIVERVVLNDEPIWAGCGKAAWERHMQRLRDGLDAIR